jgi:DNA repair protein RadC
MARLYTVHSVLRETAVDWPEGVSPDTIVNEAIIVHRLCKAVGLACASSEEFWVFLLNGTHRLLAYRKVSQGTLTSSLVHPREVFQPAIREGAAAIIVAHNHPSGDPKPSHEDLAVTDRLYQSGELLSIPLLDHVVVTPDDYVSIRAEHGLESRQSRMRALS